MKSESAILPAENNSGDPSCNAILDKLISQHTPKVSKRNSSFFSSEEEVDDAEEHKASPKKMANKSYISGISGDPNKPSKQLEICKQMDIN
jgi:hypothetical protein